MDLTTRYLGLTLRNPLIASASPLNNDIGNIRKLEDYGAGAVVMPSIFEEQIDREQEIIDLLVTRGTDSNSESLSFLPSSSLYALDTVSYTEVIRKAVGAVDIPVIASLNGTTNAGWIEYARQIEDAGASALELNIYFIPSDLDLSGRDVEQRYLDVLRAVKQTVKIPLAVKIGPYFSAPGHMALQLDEAGADGLVLFNRFYEPDIDVTSLELVSQLELSSTHELRLPLLWIAVVAGRLKASLAASTGVTNGEEVIKYILAGADVVMTTSALLRHGLSHMRVLVEQVEHWLEARNLDGFSRIRGSMSYSGVADPTAYTRANYIKTIQSYGTRSR
jgi:dihydroorotate dehydrogenase (fumarate)